MYKSVTKIREMVKKKKKIDRVKCSPQVSVVVLEYVRKTVQPAAVVEL